MWYQHIPGGPVQLHPVLNSFNNTYGITTGGHFNFGRGYDFNPNNPVWYISVSESAGGSRVPLTYWETHQNVIDANRNHPMHNIRLLSLSGQRPGYRALSYGADVVEMYEMRAAATIIAMCQGYG